MRLYDITTETGDFIANGVVSHNCYARPSHAYMGLSPGLDFETRLFYKADAARVLEKELARPGYVCKPIMLGANTDPYQPVEKRMRVTRSILEVLDAHPPPGHRHHQERAGTAGSGPARRPGARRPCERRGERHFAGRGAEAHARAACRIAAGAAAHARRAARRRCADGGAGGSGDPGAHRSRAGAILAAAAAAGVGWAGYVLLRLPYEIKDLFSEWLRSTTRSVPRT